MDHGSMTPSPIACRIDALTAEERKRRTDVLALLRARLVGTSETEDGVVFQLPGGRPGVKEFLREVFLHG